MTWYGVGTVAAGILTAIVLIGAAAAALERLLRYRVVRAALRPFGVVLVAVWKLWDTHRTEQFAAKVDEAIGRLWLPNGGASLHDLSHRLARIEERLGLAPYVTTPPVDDPPEVP